MSATGSAGMEYPKATVILLSLLSTAADAVVRAETLRQFTGEDWDALLAEAARQGVTLLLYDRLRVDEFKELVPAHFSEKLRETYLAATARNMRMLHHAEKILRALKARGIEVIVLKGLYLVENVYARIGLRTFGDLDLLVHRERLADALAVMQGLGYKLSTWYDAGEQNTDIKHLPPLQKADSPTVEVHWTILEENEPFTIAVENLWRHTVPANAAGVEALALGLEDLILHLSMHFTYQHRLRAGLRSLYDIPAVLQKHEGRVDWQQLVRTAQEWRAQRVAWLTFRLLAELTGVGAPVAVMSALQPDPVDEKVVPDALEQVLAAGTTGVALTPDLAALSSASFWKKIKLVWQRVFIPRRVLAREYNLDPRSMRISAYYFSRFFFLFKKYRNTGWEILNKNNANSLQINSELRLQAVMRWMRENIQTRKPENM